MILQGMLESTGKFGAVIEINTHDTQFKKRAGTRATSFLSLTIQPSGKSL